MPMWDHVHNSTGTDCLAMCPGGARRWWLRPADDPEREMKIGTTASVSWTSQTELFRHFFLVGYILTLRNNRRFTFICYALVETSYWDC
jgi:hypothetical protein